MLTGLCLALSVGLIENQSFPPSFSTSEVNAIKTYWAVKDRLTISPIDPVNKYQPRATGDGSEWLLKYYKSTYPGQRILPTRNPSPGSEDQRAGEAWIDRQYDHDYSMAQAQCQELNGQKQGAISEASPTPRAIADRVGVPPPFFRPQIPARYTVKFDDFVAVMDDAVQTRRKYPYFRFPEGVDVLGGPPDSRSLSKVFKAASVPASRAKVMMAVSSLEGGFASVNTYDTGYVSVGFVQFASLADGRGSLGEMMLSMKRSDHKAFQRDFRKFGIDVTTSGAIVVVDPESGKEFGGAEAAKHIIKDKRLAGVFYRAGKLSTNFQAAQIRAAIDRFYPAGLNLAVSVNGQTTSAHMSDVFRSEAGLATLMDRYVNTGNLNSVPQMVAQVMQKHNYSSIFEAAQSESELIALLKYRRDFTTGYGLLTPDQLPAVNLAPCPTLADAVDTLIDKVLASNSADVSANASTPSGNAALSPHADNTATPKPKADSALPSTPIEGTEAPKPKAEPAKIEPPKVDEPPKSGKNGG